MTLINNRSSLTSQEIVVLYQNGLTSTKIGQMAGISHNAVIGHLQRAGIERRKKVPSKYDRQAMIADYQSGLTFSKVARKHHADVSFTRKIIVAAGIPLRPIEESIIRGENHPMWKGGHRKSSGGYVVTKEGRLHRLEVEGFLRRRLEHWEAVHHIDGNRLNNTVDNLVAMPTREHQRFHAFLLHRGLKVDEVVFRTVCRCDSSHYYRFTVGDFRLASELFPKGSRSPLVAKPKPCKVCGCQGRRAGQGYCSKHYQRWKAIRRGYWLCGSGRKTPCYLTKIS